jgi:hypothetical protein
MAYKYNVTMGVSKIRRFVRARIALMLGILSSAAMLTVLPLAAHAETGNGHNTLHGDSGYTTLDACGYFSAIQTASEGSTTTSNNGSMTVQEHGTWTGVLNDATGHVTVSPVVSLGKVQGAFSETQTTTSDGVTTGTESFTSNAGKVTQTYEYGNGVPGGFVVSVTGTRDLAFLTSNTNGACYTGTFPRP